MLHLALAGRGKRLVRLRLFSCNLQQIFLSKKGSYISAKLQAPKLVFQKRSRFLGAKATTP